MKTARELKDEYKKMKFRMGVFRIRNIKNDKCFIGSSQDLDAAWNSQRFQLEAGLHSNEELQNDWAILGAENFVYEVLDELQADDDLSTDYTKELKALEELVIEELQPFGEKGYNRRKRQPTY